MVLDQNFYHNVLELDVHDGRHRLLLWAKQRRPEDHAQVGDGHQILLVVTGDTVEENEKQTENRGSHELLKGRQTRLGRREDISHQLDVIFTAECWT